MWCLKVLIQEFYRGPHGDLSVKPNPKPQEIRVDPNDTVKSVKQRISKLMNIPPIVQRLVLPVGTGEGADHQMLKNVGDEYRKLKDNDRVFILMKKKMGIVVEIGDKEFIDHYFEAGGCLGVRYHSRQTMGEFKKSVIFVKLLVTHKILHDADYTTKYQQFIRDYDVIWKEGREHEKLINDDMELWFPNDREPFNVSLWPGREWFLPSNRYYQTLQIKTKDGKKWFLDHVKEQRLNLLTFGYLRICENNLSVNVPFAIKHICKRYFIHKV